MYSKSWRTKLIQAAAMLLAITFVAHLVAALLQAVAPLLISVLILAAVYAVLIGRLRR